MDTKIKKTIAREGLVTLGLLVVWILGIFLLEPVHRWQDSRFWLRGGSLLYSTYIHILWTWILFVSYISIRFVIWAIKKLRDTNANKVWRVVAKEGLFLLGIGLSTILLC